MNFSKELIEQHKENAVTIQVVYQELLKSLHKSTGVVDAATAEALHTVAVQLTTATTGKKDPKRTAKTDYYSRAGRWRSPRRNYRRAEG